MCNEGKQMKYNIPFKTGQEINYISEAISKNNFQANGPFTKRVKAFFETRFQMGHVYLMHSCTTALEMAAILINAKAGDEVIMPAYTYVSTANAFALRGCKIVFVDVDSNFNIDLDAVEHAITNKTIAIVPVHYCGLSCDMDRLMDLANSHGIYVIEDAAQCIDAKYKDNFLGSIGHIGCISFHETKNIQCGEGGALIINDHSLLEYTDQLVDKGTNRKAFLKGQIQCYTWQTLGSSPLISEISAAFLLSQLESIDHVTQHRLALHNIYLSILGSIEEVICMDVPDYNTFNGHFFYILCQSAMGRTDLMNYLHDHQIQSLSHYEPLHQSVAGHNYGSFRGDDINTTKGAHRILRLPIYCQLTANDVTYICNTIKEFYHGK